MQPTSPGTTGRKDRGLISIWFFIGLLLFVYGVLIFVTGLYHLAVPPAHQVVLANLHAEIWWGALLVVLGAYYSLHFKPRRAR